MAKLKVDRSLEALERRIGLVVADRPSVERALTHSSLGAGRTVKSYERLEFLGDRVLGLILAEKLFQTFPDANEGELSLRLNSLVSAEACAEIADEIGLTDFIRHGGDVKRLAGEKMRNIRADVVEALIAAIYLGNGLDAARAFVFRSWGERLASAVTARRDPKTALQEWVHTRSPTPPRYETVERTGPDHDPLFTVQALAEGLAPATGRGRSKRLAEQDAAATLLAREGIWKDET